MRFHSTFSVQAPLDLVRDFHARSTSMAAITPPPIVVQMHAAPERLEEGDRMRFTLWLGPLPMRWTACIEQVSPQGFVDRQIEGPFETWEHTHHFEQAGEATRVNDTVVYRSKRHLLWGIVGRLMGAGLPLLFKYRAWRTKALLEKRSNRASAA